MEKYEIERRVDMVKLNENIMNLTIAINDLKKDHQQNKEKIAEHQFTLYGQECRGGVVQDIEIIKTTVSNIRWVLNFFGFGVFVSIVVLVKKWWND